MFLNALAGAIDAAHPKQVDYLSRQLWQAHAAGHIADHEAQDLAERLHRRRGGAVAGERALFSAGGDKGPAAAEGNRRPPVGFVRPPEQKTPDRRRSIERRRKLAASGPMPPPLAAMFTVGELAVLRIVGDEALAKGACDRSLAEIAARAGVCRKLAQLTLRLAARHGLITVERRPRPGRKNLSNVVRVVSAEWLAWIRRGNRVAWSEASRRVLLSGQGEKNFTPRSQIQTSGSARKEAGATTPPKKNPPEPAGGF